MRLLHFFFSQTVACFFILFTEQVLILMKSSFSVLPFMNCIFGVVSPNPKSSRFSPLSSKNFRVLSFTFRSVTHLVLTFGKGVRPIWIFSFLSFLFFFFFFLGHGCPVVPASLCQKDSLFGVPTVAQRDWLCLGSARIQIRYQAWHSGATAAASVKTVAQI